MGRRPAQLADPAGQADPVDVRHAPHVAVIGAGLAGLFAAAAASSAGCRVSILERDRLSDDPAPRSGVPQGEQPHVFLHRGMLAAEQLLPGLADDLVDGGAVRLNTGRLPWLGEHGWSPIGDHGFEIVSMSRPFLESAVRRRVEQRALVKILSGVRVLGLQRQPSGWRIETSGPESGSPHRTRGASVLADVVIDASGRTSRFGRWLETLGLQEISVSWIDAGIGYATRRYAGPVADGVVIVATPQTPRGGLALPIENGAWLVAAVGVADHRPPRSTQDFLAYLPTLRDPALAARAGRLTGVGEVAVHRQTANLRHHYEAVTDWPAGLLVLGDALCAFNPVYGQGITVAACQAEVLARSLRRRGTAAVTRRLQRRLAEVADFPWAVATGEDLRFPSSEGRQSRRQALLSGWAREVGHLMACGNPRAAVTLSRIYHLMGSPLGLFHPALLVAAARARLRGYPPPVPRPSGPGRRTRRGEPAAGWWQASPRLRMRPSGPWSARRREPGRRAAGRPRRRAPRSGRGHPAG